MTFMLSRITIRDQLMFCSHYTRNSDLILLRKYYFSSFDYFYNSIPGVISIVGIHEKNKTMLSGLL